MPRPTLRRVVVIAVLAVLALVEVRRAAHLWRHPDLLTAHGERAFFAWSYRRDDLPRLFARIESRLAPGEAVRLVVPSKGPRAGWWTVMAHYYLPRQPLLGVVHGRDASGRSGDATLVVISRRGARLVRPAPGALE